MRKDGVRVKNIDPMYTLAPYFMRERNDALNNIKLQLPFAPMKTYINKRRREGVALSYMSLILAAYTRVLAEYPALNRFVVRQKIYAHTDITVALVILKDGKTTNTDADDETMVKLHFAPTDTIDIINQKIIDLETKSRDVNDVNSLDKLMKLLLYFDFLPRIATSIFRFLDRYGWLPKFAIDASPFHASMVISNLASIRLGTINHHVYNFGTISVICVMGVPEDKVEKIHGAYETVRYIPMEVTMDERIANGAYYGKAFRRFLQYIEHPEVLEKAPDFPIKKDY